jgi:hypothetical protein
VKLLVRLSNTNIDTSTKPVKYLPIFLQMAFNLIGLFAANELALHVWRAMTGH